MRCRLQDDQKPVETDNPPNTAQKNGQIKLYKDTLNSKLTPINQQINQKSKKQAAQTQRRRMKFSVLFDQTADTALIFAQAIAKDQTRRTSIFNNERFFFTQVDVWR